MGKLKFCPRTLQTHRIRFCCQNFCTVDNSQVIPAYARNFNINVYMKITFDPNHISKIWQQSAVLPTHNISEQSTLR